MLGRTLRTAKEMPAEGAIVLGTYDTVTARCQSLGKPPELPPDGYWLKTLTVDGKNHLVIAAPNERGVLYGAFALLRMIGLEAPIADLNVRDKPYAPIRILNHWDNLDGTIERGYAGRSIFWENGHVTKDLGRVRDYARLMASVGINGCSINNVNADVRVISAELLPEVARVADVFRPYGVKLFLSLDFASPRKIGGINTFDPLDPAAVAFWKTQGRRNLQSHPRPRRLRAQGRLRRPARPVRVRPHPRRRRQCHRPGARAARRHPLLSRLRLRPQDGLEEPEERPRERRLRQLSSARRQVPRQRHRPDQARADRLPGPRAGVAAVRRPCRKPTRRSSCRSRRSTSASSGTSVFLVPMWKEVLDFDMKANPEAKGDRNDHAGEGPRLRHHVQAALRRVRRRLERRPRHQLARPSPGDGEPLRLRPAGVESQPRKQADRRGVDAAHLRPRSEVVGTIVDMLLKSWSIYENYTGPYGVGTLTDIIHVHYGPGIESSENNGWGQWHRADEKGIGMDRTVATGTGFIGQYSPAVARVFESLDTCPDELLLVHAPRAVQARAPLRQDADPAHLRFALRRRPRRRPAGPQLGDAQGPHRRGSATKKCSTTSSTRPATPRSGATRSPIGSSARVGHRRRQETRRQPSRPRRSRGDAARRLRGARTSRPGKPPPAARPPHSPRRPVTARSATNSPASRAGTTSTSPTSTKATASRSSSSS